MLMQSMVAASTAAMAHATARSRMRTASTSRRCGSSSLLSLRPRTGRSGESTTAAATTGPNSAPRPGFIHARYGVETARAQLALERRFAPEFATRRLRPHGRTVTVRAL